MPWFAKKGMEASRPKVVSPRALSKEVEFVTVMWFDSLEAVRAFAGEDYEVAVVPRKARALLSRFDASSQHYEVKAEMKI